jgi:hypothetical protein
MGDARGRIAALMGIIEGIDHDHDYVRIHARSVVFTWS